MVSFTSVRMFGAIVGAVILAAGGSALAEGPPLYLGWSIDGGPTNGTWPPGVSAGGGSFEYTGSAVDPQTGLTLSWDLTSGPVMQFNGFVSIWNELPDTIEVAVEIVRPVGNGIPVQTELSAFVAIGLTTGQGGGQIDSNPAFPFVWDTVIDGKVVGPATSLFAHPFQVWHSGAGTSSTTAQYGMPTPVPGPPVLGSAGYDLRFVLSDGDLGAVTTILSAGAATCLGDVNFDDEVGIIDLTSVIGAWGACGAEGLCTEDIDANGAVDVVDLLIVLEHWGPCP